jgi:DNA-binding transcriptional ArsR family regulator
MHPILALRNIEGLEKEVVRILSSSPGALSQGEILKQLAGKTTQPSLSRAMARLAEQGIITKSGSTRKAAFELADNVRSFARPAHLRHRVEYDPQRIGAYEPNVTNWLSADAEVRMRDAATSVEHQLDASTYSKQIAERFLIDLSWASSALEGNTYDYLQTEALIKYGSEAQGHDVQEATMILNHKRAITLLLEDLEKGILAPNGVQRLHALLMQTFVSPEDLGRIRANDVMVTGTAYKPSTDHHQLVSDFGSLLWKVEQIENPFEASFVLLVGLSYLQAFVDGNKRVGRLTSNIPLLRKSLPPMSFIGTDKSEYLAGLIYFYETGDSSLLSDVVSRGYAAVAPSYKVAVATQRKPRSIELRERKRIEEAIQKQVLETLNDGHIADLEEAVERDFSDLQEPDRAIVLENIQEALASLNSVNSIVWGVTSADAERYAEAKLNAGPPRP